MKRDYELVVLLHPDLEVDLERPLAKIRKLIADNGGEITKEDNWGKRKLAYRIKGEDFAVYMYFEAKLPVEAVKKIQNVLNITDESLRYLLTAVDPHEAMAAEAAKKHQEADAAAEKSEE
ncbi:MAG TPA: 30S ribosomal protein S6 [Candidatus Acidoferrum sp.]|nr:30S ribosomal protein S6 [Candidatus Acidoferrum sp.]